MANVLKLQFLLAANLKKHRTRMGLTQMELAERCNISTSFIGEIEICRKFPSARTLQKLIDALGILPEELFSEDIKRTGEPTQRYMTNSFRSTLLQLRKQLDSHIDRVIDSIEE